MPVAGILTQVTSSITGWIGDYGLYAVFLLMLVDAVFPAASEVVMVYAGAVAAGAFAGQSVTFLGFEFSSGVSAYIAMALAGTIGYLLGSIGGWWIGVRGGRPFLERNGRWLHLDAAKLDRAEAWFARFGERAVLIGRVTPVVRSFISVPAGVFKAPLGRYVILTAIGSAVWCFAFAGAGWAAGANWEDFHDRFRFVDYLVLAGVAVGLAAIALKLRRRGSS
jgi:membrane protein DedA with SNARE-associated domain